MYMSIILPRVEVTKKLKITKTQITVNSAQSTGRKNTNRGRGRVNRRTDSFSVLLVNLRGFKSKEMSLKKVIEEEEAKHGAHERDSIDRKAGSVPTSIHMLV